jgi:geranylgeranyl reductase family protein
MSRASGAAYDAIVVGSGPAGAHLAYLLARTGRRVALLDRARFPRDKVCGGGVSRKSVAQLGLDLAPVVHRWLAGAYLTYRNGSVVAEDIAPAAGCTVVREEFDQLLLERARAAGAEFFAECAFLDAEPHGSGVVASTSRGKFIGHRLYGADGAGSSVRAKLFGRGVASYVPALEALVRVPDAERARFDDRAVFDFGAMPRGYGWIFPKRDHLNVGVYSPFGGNALRKHLDRFMDCYPALRRRQAVRYRGFAIAIGNPAGAFERGAAALVGDAAGLAEALFGEGIYFALKSATLAAEAQIAREADARAATYVQRLRRELLPELRAARWLARCAFSFPLFAFGHLVCNEEMRGLFAGLISGQTGYRECLRKVAIAAPAWLLHSPPSRDAAVA